MVGKPKTAIVAAPEPVADGAARVMDAIRGQQRLLAAAVVLPPAAAVDVHRGRVAARRLRSLLKTFRPLLETRRAKLYRADLRSFARALGGVREADVRRDLLLAIAAKDNSIPPGDRKRLDQLLDDACIAAREALTRHQAEPGWAVLRRALERHGTGDEGLIVERGATLTQVLGLVAHSWRRAVRKLEEEPESAVELHELRLALKHCRYAQETVADIVPIASIRLIRCLRAAQDCIGEHRDAMLADHWLRSNERVLGHALAARLAADLQRRERVLRKRAARRSRRVLVAWQEWRAATLRLRRASNPGRA